MTEKKVAGLFLTLIALSVFLLFPSSVSASESRSDTSKVIEDFLSPESVILTPDGKRVFVSNVGEKLAPSAKDGDGFISEMTPDGRIVKKKFLPLVGSGRLNAPKGMAIVGVTLYVADIDRIVGFNIDTGKETFLIDMSETGTVFLNDITAIDDNTLFVSATDIGRVYSVSLGDKPVFTEAFNVENGPNGLYYDNASKKLYVAEYGAKGKGQLGEVDMTKKPLVYERLGGPEGALDGIAMIPGNRILYSDWVEFGKPGAFHVYDIKAKTFSDMKLSRDIKGPADFRYDEKTNTIYAPMMVEGKVLIQELK